jgi:Zn-dependent peptidase ImmA (M78 family)
MLKLQTSYSFSNVPYITYEALDQYAEAVLRHAMPKLAAPGLLSEPTVLDVMRFIEFYCEMDIEYKRINCDRKIMAMTAFNSGIIQVFDDAGIEPLPLPVRGGTVIIDPILMQKRNIARRRFTFMHEGSHWLIHRPAFSEDNPYGTPGVFENQYLAAKEGRIDYSRSQKERTDSERIERQADFLASALLMPKTTLRMAFKDFFKVYGERAQAIVRGRSAWDDCFAIQLPEYVAVKFGVSKRAALIRLEKLGAIVGNPSPAWRLHSAF